MFCHIFFSLYFLVPIFSIKRGTPNRIWWRLSPYWPSQHYGQQPKSAHEQGVMGISMHKNSAPRGRESVGLESEFDGIQSVTPQISLSHPPPPPPNLVTLVSSLLQDKSIFWSGLFSQDQMQEWLSLGMIWLDFDRGTEREKPYFQVANSTGV